MFVSLDVSNVETDGFNCGEGEKSILMNSTSYNLQDLYDCGYSAGRKWGKQLPNSSTKDFMINKKLLLALLLLFISHLT